MNGKSSRPNTARKAAIAAGWLTAALAIGCIDPTRIGNFSGRCPAGTACDCNIVGNCEYDCPGGSCTLRCLGTGNCLFSCQGGGCELECQNTGNCITTCSGNGCSMTCTGTGNCSLDGCTSGCTSTCQNFGTCTCSVCQ